NDRIALKSNLYIFHLIIVIRDKISTRISSEKIITNEKNKYFFEYENPLYGNKLIAVPNMNPDSGIPIRIV
ncbi:MAG TPA: hypothetical protein VK796_07955, partial [Cytophaga sp.]|nr:hypothetical protein [Cytophaga sp.]